MEAAGELRWDIEPSNGRNCFFTRESYEKYCLGPTLAELLLITNKPPPAGPTQKEASSSQAPVPDSQPVVPSSTKQLLPFPEPRVPYPRFSSLTAFEQDAYVKLMIKFHNKKNSNVSFGQVKDYNHYEFLKSKSSLEVPEFQKFLQNAARSCAEDYDVLCADADLYVQEMLKICQTYVKNYPPIYTVHEITSILGGKFIPDLTFKLEKCLLKMGSVKFVKMTFPSDGIPLLASYKKGCQMMPPVKKASHVHASVSSDPNISKLAPKYCPQVVLTSQALFALLNNHAPGYNEQWEIPVCVETGTGTDGKPCKVVYIDSPLPKKELSTRERSQMFHEVVLDKFMMRNYMIPLKGLFLDRDQMDLHYKEHYTNRSIYHEDKEVDFASDVTELETFFSVDKDVNSSKMSSDSESLELSQTSLKKSLLDRLHMEKQIINSTPALSRFSSDEGSDVKKKKLSNEEGTDMRFDTENKLRTCSASSTGAQATTSSNDSDSDNEKLVIDIDCKMSEGSNVVVTPSVSTTPKAPRRKKPSRKIPKDIDPLGQILKMQEQLLKVDTKKMEQINPEKSEQSSPHAPSFQQNASSSCLESQRKVEVRPSSNDKYLLSSDLMAMQEDAAEYTVEPEENCSYKMFSLGDMLLLLKTTVHTAKTRPAVKKAFKCQIPVFVLAKVDYQTCYGVESLTESERCRLWTESLIHSKCEFFVGHVDALTSKFFMLEEITAENLKESMNNFRPANCLNSLHHILKWVTGLQDGSYLLSHVSGDSSVCLYKSTKDQQRGAYNLHDAHCNAPEPPSSLSVPWVPLNPNLLLKYHIQHGRPPCTFPPAAEVDTGIKKSQLHEPQKAPCKEKTKVSPATYASKVTKAKQKGRNRRNKLKARQKAQKAAAALQGNK
ncbi:little elongation complex subunit 2 isoform X1 [Bufo gargarizans]|uniref:little elongation complex subunit 2 isoform X1 n=2 Tax=Bufo gargarizans TaxID=30331 RepID=UPI001CF31CF5|nr:little elongation complex subunit 2 isoform X1 [Bufo gargarizans]